MAIESAIITQWSNDSTLNGLVPSTSVTGGTVMDDKLSNSESEYSDPVDLLPRARLEVEAGGFTNSNKTNYELHTVTVRTTTSTNSSANLIRAAIHDAFRNKTWTANGHRILLSRVTGTDKVQIDNGDWQLETTIEVESVEV